MNITHESNNMLKGLLWGLALCVPLWLSFFGWIKLVPVIFKILEIKSSQ